MSCNKKYILFSPVGHTDPIRKGHDGALLHIIRHYKPYKVYLYLTKDILAIQAQDNRYKRAIEKLTASLGAEIAVINMEHPEDNSPHLFDYCYDKFLKAIDTICEENPELKEDFGDTALILNLSSGTPAMKGALYAISKIGNIKAHCVAYQVSDPQSETPRGKENQPYDVEYEWKNDKDNEANAKNRITQPTGEGILSLYYKGLIKNYVEEYNYDAALTIYNKMILINKGNVKLGNLLQGAVMRKNGALDSMGNYFDKAEITEPFFRNKKYRAIEEYILSIEIKSKRKEYGDFIRAISPVIDDLFEYMLKELGGERETRKVPHSDRVKKDDTERMKDKIMFLCSARGATFNDIENYTADLRNVEYSCRNVAAHEITSVDDNWIKDKCNKSSEEIIKILKRYVAKLDAKLNPSDWDSYKRLNALIISTLDDIK